MWSDTPQISHWTDRYPLESCPSRIETAENERVRLKADAEKARLQALADPTGGESDSKIRGARSVLELREAYGLDRFTFAKIHLDLFGPHSKLRSQVYATAYRKLVAEIEKRGYKPCP